MKLLQYSAEGNESVRLFSILYQIPISRKQKKFPFHSRIVGIYVDKDWNISDRRKASLAVLFGTSSEEAICFKAT
jgi:hypothetical protein